MGVLRRSRKAHTRTLKTLYELKNVSKITINVQSRRNKERTGKGCSVWPDMSRILPRLKQRGYADSTGFPIHSKLLILKSEYEVVTHYKQVLIGNLNYYAPCVRSTKPLHRIAYILKYSCAKRLANINKTSISKIFTTRRKRMTRRLTKKIYNPRTEKTNLQTYKRYIDNRTSLIKVAVSNFHLKKDTPKINPYTVSVNLRTIIKLTNVCVRCGCTGDVSPLAHHHTNACSDIKCKGWKRFWRQLNRKQF